MGESLQDLYTIVNALITSALNDRAGEISWTAVGSFTDVPRFTSPKPPVMTRTYKITEGDKIIETGQIRFDAGSTTVVPDK